MIRIEYINKEIKVYTEDVSKLYNTPLKLVISNSVTHKDVWSCEMGDNSWATYPNNEMMNVTIYDGLNVVLRRNWNVITDGDVLYKSLLFYCSNFFSKTNKFPNGLVVGTHDGDFGEWVPVVRNYHSRATLVEASEPQYEGLVKNYKSFSMVTMLNTLVTTDGKPIEFFEGGRGYTNSVVPRVIKAWEKEPITSSIKQSTKINDIIEDMGSLDWLHLDVEGYDAALIMSILPHKLPPLIIFENNNMLPDDKEGINRYLRQGGYFLREEPVSTLAIKQ